MGESDTRLANTIRPDLKRRLKLAATLAGQTVSRYLEHLLERDLPSDDELARRIQEGGIPR